MDIAVNDLQKRIKPNPRLIKTIAITVLRGEGVRRADVSITLVSSQRIRALNKKFLHRTYATDVLSFDLSDDKTTLRGEVIVSSDAARINARKFNTNVKQEFARYVIHGLLHLTGYDDVNETRRKRMRSREERYLNKFKGRIPAIFSEAKG